MNLLLPQVKSQGQPTVASSPSPIFLPEELITKVLPFLPVKSLMRLKCVCKSWETLISDPSFVKLHLQQSTRNPQLLLVYGADDQHYDSSTILPISLNRLLENSSITLTNDPYYRLNDDVYGWVVGSCNGLICMLKLNYSFHNKNMWLRFWNPATRTMSDKLGHCDIEHYLNLITPHFQLTFGYVNSSDTYKVVLLHRGVKVFSSSDNVWRTIENFPYDCYYQITEGVHLSGSVNWLVICNCSQYMYDCEYTNVDQYVIVSLDLGTETYKELLLPRGFDEVPCIEPTLCVLMDCICFSHLVKETHLVIWQMTEYGVEESWNQLFKINLQIIDYEFDEVFHSQWFPLHLSQNRNTLILLNYVNCLPVVYNLRDDSVKITQIVDGYQLKWNYYIKNYVESLVLCH